MRNFRVQWEHEFKPERVAIWGSCIAPHHLLFTLTKVQKTNYASIHRSLPLLSQPQVDIDSANCWRWWYDSPTTAVTVPLAVVGASCPSTLHKTCTKWLQRLFCRSRYVGSVKTYRMVFLMSRLMSFSSRLEFRDEQYDAVVLPSYMDVGRRRRRRRLLLL